MAYVALRLVEALRRVQNTVAIEDILRRTNTEDLLKQVKSQL